MQLVWFRNDLRLADNPALSAACAAGERVKALVCLTPEQWTEHNESEARQRYWHARLDWLEQALLKGGIELIRLPLQRFSDCPDAILQVAQQQGASKLHFNYEYPLNERNRDRLTCERLESEGIAVQGHHGDLIVPPGQVVTGQGTAFKVFTPFSKAWLRCLLRLEHEPLPSPVQGDECARDQKRDTDKPYRAGKRIQRLGSRYAPEPDTGYPVNDDDLHEVLQRFVHEQEPDYQRLRDFPARHATSGLSPALTIGALSARQCLARLKQAHDGDGWQQSTWLNELVWREFYRHLLVSFPELNRLTPFRPDVEARITWLDNEKAFEAWKAGETGFPIVDAAMKQLLATGWMHNRLRMIVASFLTKLLRIDWRRGEAFFMSKLIDGDFASNLGGWQWSASVGADAAPYFRIFNPQLQSEKFDPNGEFIAEWLPELRHLEPKARHKPGAGQEYGRPGPIIDYKQARQSALDDYNGG
ncbi:cryptochrome/photolyase family protein [Marinobacterium sediminicola]|uniref:Deoxyribodipyrimidine photo-lyase n=1 Tax=Marinobacterium sediminicola TaxID=518898 RepID=A0ABY1S3G2_9GAMM|nr:FAD-binding domain-containing protein [Marinobacterium sediminicola]ULG68239.1 deoxyribodipyrimidine photo-lyase [Marinobacterium sediminicola]SMR77791.1 deoxyribodipyrimidine photo-lyase [Marinobacterium sediminicola]